MKRFWSKVRKECAVTSTYVTTPCWVWTAGKSGPYGSFSWNGRTHFAHRVGWMLTKGEIDAETLDHLCRNKLCVRPGHLEPVSRGVNTMRGDTPAAKNMQKTLCLRGHELVPCANRRRVGGTPWRRCRTCSREWGRTPAAKAARVVRNTEASL